MIDTWFKEDLHSIFKIHSVAVFIDESGDAEFLLNTVKNEFIIYQANTELEELRIKYLIEKAQPSHEKFLIYTLSKKDDLKFVREYCEINGCLEIRYLQNYIKDKVHQTLNLNINLPKAELISAAKISVGKDRTYWIDLSHKGSSEIFDMTRELLPFLHDPDSFAREKYDDQLRLTFYRKINELLGQDYLHKPAATLAAEVVKSMLDGLACGDCNKTLEDVYSIWLDSMTFRNSFCGYLSNYSLSAELDIWNVSIDHPFRQVDEKWLTETGKKIIDKSSIPDILTRLRQRSLSKQAQSLGIVFWSDVIILLEFDPADITYLSSFDECVEFYRKHFYKLDTAIRNLYAEFLNKKELLEPFQELYKEYVSIFLDKWFKHWNGYKEKQTGVIKKIIDESSSVKTAIIVGDGVSYEIAEQVTIKVKGKFRLNKDVILADIPSETENNMSRIYMDNGLTEAIQSNREKYLVAQNPDINFDFIRLDEINEEARPGQILICTYKDIDDMGEKLQQKALKFFPEIIDFFAEKISLLLSCGYNKVYLITDHGFVLTGFLTEADKILDKPNVPGKCYERYFVSDNCINDDKWIVKERSAEYFYFAKSMNPFKSPGVYGFSHGGVTPQEIITPNFCWIKDESTSESLPVFIDNKGDLKNITGELFPIKLKADKGSDDLFTVARTVFLVFFANKVQINKSDVFTIKKNELILKEYTFDGNPEIEVQLLDAITKQLIDKAFIKQNKERDLGGLL